MVKSVSHYLYHTRHTLSLKPLSISSHLLYSMTMMQWSTHSLIISCEDWTNCPRTHSLTTMMSNQLTIVFSPLPMQILISMSVCMVKSYFKHNNCLSSPALETKHHPGTNSVVKHTYIHWYTPSCSDISFTMSPVLDISSGQCGVGLAPSWTLWVARLRCWPAFSSAISDTKVYHWAQMEP
jgi:hypothetical protein